VLILKKLGSIWGMGLMILVIICLGNFQVVTVSLVALGYSFFFSSFFGCVT
jgi:hypothetical protein